MRPLLRAIAAFVTCFGVGAALHFFIQREPRTWILPGLITSVIVATFAYCGAR